MPGREPLSEDLLRQLLTPRWQRVQVLDETASTNADLMQDTSAPDRTVLVAEVQTAGRGRLDRTWSSPRGAGLTFSVLVRPDVPLQHWGWMPLLAGVALYEAVTSSTDVAAALKWPNDLLVGPGLGKAAGILAQTSGEAIVVGIGLNVSTRADELPVPEATSLELAGAGDVDRAALLVDVLTVLDARIAQWCDVGGDAEACGLADAYRRACATLGRQVVVVTAAGEIRGEAVDVDGAGRLLVQTDVDLVPVSAGDVRHVRPN
jgi:BirA family biotin operon repressor/biotin-[acetyl-CoA-carboxylase] ligase